MNNNARPRSHSVGEGERNRQHILHTIPPDAVAPVQHFPASPSFPFTSHPTGLYSDPLDDILASLTQYDQFTQPLEGTSDLTSMSPHHQQLDPTTLAWLQFLQSQVPAQSDPGVASPNGADEHPGRSSTQPAHPPETPADPEEEVESETERTATAEDKRRRNTAASARFRSKKKQWLVSMERTVTSLSRQVEELEREAADLRRENGWLKEIVMLKTRRLTGEGSVNLSGPARDQNDTGKPDTVKGKKRQQ